MSSVERTILLVEDDPAAQRLFQEAMTESRIGGLQIASTGAEARTYFSSDSGCVPDMVVLDLDLPDLNGLRLLEDLKSGPTPLRRIPILILSNSTEQADIDRAYDLGANAYLTKPDSYGDLLALVEDVRSFWLRRIQFPGR